MLYYLLAQSEPLLTSKPDGSYDWTNLIGYVITAALGGLGFWYKARLDSEKAKQEAENTLRQELEKARLQREADIKNAEQANITAYYNELKEQQKATFQALVEQQKVLMAQNTAFHAEIGELRDKVKHLEDRLAYYEGNPALAQARELLECLMENCLVYPTWIHDLGANKWYLSDAYCKTFSVERPHFWTPIDILSFYDPQDTTTYLQHDLAVVQSGSPQTFVERVRKRIMDPECTEYLKIKIRKAPCTINGNRYVSGTVLEFLEEGQVETGEQITVI